MLRTLTCVGVGLLLASGTAYAQVNPQTQGRGAQAQPAQAQPQGQIFQTGKIVSINPDKGTVVIRRANGQEQEFRTSNTTKYYGMANQQLREGLRAKDYRAGANVRWQAQGTNLNELRLGTGTTVPGGTTRPGGTTTPPGGATRPGGTGTPPPARPTPPPPPE